MYLCVILDFPLWVCVWSPFVLHLQFRQAPFTEENSCWCDTSSQGFLKPHCGTQPSEGERESAAHLAVYLRGMPNYLLHTGMGTLPNMHCRNSE